MDPTKPRNACEMQYYNQALSEMRMLLDRHPEYKRAIAMYNGNIPEWMLSAAKQHALFYAREKCTGR